MSTYNSADIAAFNGGVWVFCEQRQGTMMPTSFELISEGRKLADELGTKLYGILLGHNIEGIAKELGGYGADGAAGAQIAADVGGAAAPPVCTPVCAPTVLTWTSMCPSTSSSCVTPPLWPLR